ncbi:MAG: putative glycosyltransferase [Acidimicrobiaceae bacterium]|nr:putative glycosyltransferase [Acidimicrobiaceae bacterium]
MREHSSVGSRCAAVVVNREAGGALLDCVASLRSAGISEIVVVDNSSADGSLERLAGADPAAVLVPTGRNLGYGRAANIGAQRIALDYVLICNPDLVVAPDAVATLVSRLDAQPDCAIVGPRLDNPDGSRYPSARAFPSLGDAAGHALVGLVVPDNRWSRRYRMEEYFDEQSAPGAAAAEAAEVDWVSGACFLARRSGFSSVGGFDEGYFMYAEDVDLCWRLRRAGWRVLYDQAAVVVHAQGLSTSRHPVRMLVAHHRSTWRFARRSARGSERALLPLVAAALAARLVVSLARELTRRGPSRAENATS